MRDGSWLLVENVNMCSAAVLDRLNALLEPGGCLTLGERGVKLDGTLHTIVPHHNFRLFFTMDPRNGDISRYGQKIFWSACNFKMVCNKMLLSSAPVA